jgi:hypothetical protein
VASEPSRAQLKAEIRATPKPAPAGPPVILYVFAMLALLGLGVWGYLRFLDKAGRQELALTPEAKVYVRELRLSDVEMKATESYMKQTVIEIDGTIANVGSRPLDVIEINCLFRDTYGQLVLRRRVPIVGSRMGGLKPGESKSFRLPFDDIPESWNQAMPQLVIAGMKFS